VPDFVCLAVLEHPLGVAVSGRLDLEKIWTFKVHTPVLLNIHAVANVVSAWYHVVVPMAITSTEDGAVDA